MRFVRQTAVQGLDFLSAGKSEQPAAELVDPESVEWFLREATTRYELVVIDTAPNLAVPDPLMLCHAVEGELRRWQPEEDEIDRVAGHRQLAQPGRV